MPWNFSATFQIKLWFSIPPTGFSKKCCDLFALKLNSYYWFFFISLFSALFFQKLYCIVTTDSWVQGTTQWLNWKKNIHSAILYHFSLQLDSLSCLWDCKATRGDTAHLFNANVVEKKMRSARQRSHQSGIDSRSDLTYMRYMGVNILIMSAQKSSVPLAGLKLQHVARISSVLLLWPRPSLTRLWLSGIWLCQLFPSLASRH